MIDHVRFALSRPFEYSHAGERTTAQFIELNEPTSRNLSEVGVLRQSMVQAIRSYDFEAQQVQAPAPVEETDSKSKKDDGISAAEVLSILSASPVKLEQVYSAGKSLVLSRGIAKVDGQEPMTQVLFDKMSARDVEQMIGTLIASFILAS